MHREIGVLSGSEESVYGVCRVRWVLLVYKMGMVRSVYCISGRSVYEFYQLLERMAGLLLETELG